MKSSKTQLDYQRHDTLPETIFARPDGWRLWFAAVAVDPGRSGKSDAPGHRRMDPGPNDDDCLSGALSSGAIIASASVLQKTIDPAQARWRAVVCRSYCGSNPVRDFAFFSVRGELKAFTARS